MQMLTPSTALGTNLDFSYMPWLQELVGEKTFFGYCLEWPGIRGYTLPKGYELYVLTFFMEAIDIDWVERTAKDIDAQFILLSDCNYYTWTPPKNVACYTYYSWHKSLNIMQQWWPNQKAKKIKFKASAFCNRISQSKIFTFTALAEYLSDSCWLTLNNWLIDDSLPEQKTGRPNLDELCKIFFDKYYGKIIKHDNFDNNQNNNRYNSNPWTPAYQESALHFTNESYHYSLTGSGKSAYIQPGPFITEKTFKCLLGATGFVPVGQFDTIGTLQKLGFVFSNSLNYSFDQSAGNLDRLEKIVTIIKDLAQYTPQDIYELTRLNAEHNQEYIVSGDFYSRCSLHNQTVQNEIISKFKH